MGKRADDIAILEEQVETLKAANTDWATVFAAQKRELELEREQRKRLEQELVQYIRYASGLVAKMQIINGTIFSAEQEARKLGMMIDTPPQPQLPLKEG